jgi:hypothetical protein
MWPPYDPHVRTKSLAVLHRGIGHWNVMAQAQKRDFVFWRNRRVHLNRRGRQFIRLLAAEVCASTVVMLDTSCSEVVGRVLATHSIHQFPLNLPTPYVTVRHHISTGVYTISLNYFYNSTLFSPLCTFFGAVCSSPDGDERVPVVMATFCTGYTFGAYRRCNWISCECVCHKLYVMGNSNNTPLAHPLRLSFAAAQQRRFNAPE